MTSGTGPQVPGVMTRGILDPSTYYYRRLITDAVPALDAAPPAPRGGSGPVVVAGISQGGGLSLAAAALGPTAAALVDVPFLCHFRRAVEITDEAPYAEIRRCLRTRRDEVGRLPHAVLRRRRHPGAAWRRRRPVSRRAEDEICPPSTVFAAYNAYGGPKEIRVSAIQRR